VHGGPNGLQNAPSAVMVSSAGQIDLVGGNAEVGVGPVYRRVPCDVDIGRFDRITATLAAKLDSAGVLLAFYSERYPTRYACQRERNAFDEDATTVDISIEIMSWEASNRSSSKTTGTV
jgi:hypothetical protein